jgi:glyoxylate carboligase
VVKSRVRLHIIDAFKLIYDEGPLDTNKKRRVPYEAVYATTDPVAMDVLGWAVVEEHRKNNGLPTLKDAGREPTYIRIASDLGLGIADKNRISLREVRI